MMNMFLAGIIDGNPLPHVTDTDKALKTGLMITFVILGAVALLMIVIAGLRLVLSSGEPNKVAEARRQIVYALVGLVIAALAGTIVNFVLKAAS